MLIFTQAVAVSAISAWPSSGKMWGATTEAIAAMMPVITNARNTSAGSTVRPATSLLIRMVKSLCGIDFQNNIELLRQSALNASAK